MVEKYRKINNKRKIIIHNSLTKENYYSFFFWYNSFHSFCSVYIDSSFYYYLYKKEIIFTEVEILMLSITAV